MIFVLNQFVRLVSFLSVNPINLPKRLERIQEVLRDNPEYSGLVSVDVEGFDVDCQFDIQKISKEELKILVKGLQRRVDLGEFRVNKEEEVQYLLTKTRRCCDTALKAKWTDGTKATLFTSTGAKNVISFTFTCQVCHCKFYPSYVDKPDESGDVLRTYTKIEDTADVFHITQQTFFSLEFLRCLTYDVAITHVEFSNFCEAYNAKYSTEISKDLNVRRLFDAYLIYHLAKRIEDFSFNVLRNNWRGIDTESICAIYYPVLKDSIDFRWLRHICSSPGCLRRLVIGDGVQKLFRNRCEAVGEQVILERGELNPLRACPENPLPKESSCAAHLNGQSAPLPNQQNDIRRITRQSAHELGMSIEELSTNAGCRPKENITTNETNRTVTCGMLFFFRDCFIRLGHVEMLTAESCTIIVLALIDLFGRYPSQTLINGLAFDRACELNPFLRNKGLNGNDVLRFWSSISMVVDKFHVGGHKRPECTLGDPNCKFHPDHPSNKDLWGDVNTEVAEESFRQLNKSKFSTRYMSRARRMVYFKIQDDEFNSMLEKKMSKKQTLIVSGSDVTYKESRDNSKDKTTPPENFRMEDGDCSSSVDQQETYEQPLENVFSGSAADSQSQFEESSSGSYTCDVCGLSLTSHMLLFLHLGTHF